MPGAATAQTTSLIPGFLPATSSQSLQFPLISFPWSGDSDGTVQIQYYVSRQFEVSERRRRRCGAECTKEL
eukprot:236368-Rhodomonas_salina.3